MIFKTGVKIMGIRPELMMGLMVADRIYSKCGRNLVVTSLLDGKHSDTSLHYCGNAADLRTRYFDKGTLIVVVNKLKESLTDEFDVVLESDHIHLEFQPKGNT